MTGSIQDGLVQLGEALADVVLGALQEAVGDEATVEEVSTLVDYRALASHVRPGTVVVDASSVDGAVGRALLTFEPRVALALLTRPSTDDDGGIRLHELSGDEEELEVAADDAPATEAAPPSELEVEDPELDDADADAEDAEPEDAESDDAESDDGRDPEPEADADADADEAPSEDDQSPAESDENGAEASEDGDPSGDDDAPDDPADAEGDDDESAEDTQDDAEASEDAESDDASESEREPESEPDNGAGDEGHDAADGESDDAEAPDDADDTADDDADAAEDDDGEENADAEENDDADAAEDETRDESPDDGEPELEADGSDTAGADDDIEPDDEAEPDDGEPVDLDVELTSTQLAGLAELGDRLNNAVAEELRTLLGQRFRYQEATASIVEDPRFVVRPGAVQAICTTFGLRGHRARLIQFAPNALVMRAARAFEDLAEHAKNPLHQAGAGPSEEALGSMQLRVSVELGRTTIELAEALSLPLGAVVELEQEAEEPVDLIVNGMRYGTGRLIVTDDGEWAMVIDEITPEPDADVPAVA